jgi:hypothetical protein
MKPRRDIAVVVLAVGAFVVAVSLQIMRDRWYPRDDVEREQILYVRSGAALKRIALSFDAVAADVYWIRAIQHYGGERLSGRRRRPSISCSSHCSISRPRSIRTSILPIGSARSF